MAMNVHIDGNDSMALCIDSEQQQRMVQIYDELDFYQVMQNYIDFGQNLDVPSWDDLFVNLDSYHAMDIDGHAL